MTASEDKETILNRELNATGGILRLKATFVARTFYPALGRLGLKEYEVGKRGWLCERWIASSVEADNPIKVENEGLSFVALPDKDVDVTLAQALELLPDRMLGDEYAKEHDNRFGVLTKLLDIGYPIPWHLHARAEHARKYWNMNPKEEAYYFLDAAGPLPYSHIGVHPGVTADDLLPILERWNDDKVLDLSPAYRLCPGEGFHVLPGIPHAPGTALTFEIQEESDVYNMLQALHMGRIISKELMFRGLPDVRTVSDLIDWEKSSDPGFYLKYHTTPEKIESPRDERNGVGYWILNPNRTAKFSGKELRVPPGKTFESQENGAYALLAWKGQGKVNEIGIKAGDHSMDELFVTAEAAREPHRITNRGKDDLVVYKIFGPDVNKAPMIYDS